MEQPKKKPQETLEFNLNRRMETFSFNPPKNLLEEGRWVLAVTGFEATNSVFSICDENDVSWSVSFSMNLRSYWRPLGSKRTIDKLKE